jgi:hypothetical protein
MRALISPQENNRILEVKVIDFPVALPFYWIDCPDNVTTNWKYVGGSFVAPTPEPIPEIIEVSMRQARLALLQYSLLQAVDDTLNGPNTPQAVKIEWEYAATVDKRSPLVANMKALLGLTDAQLTNLFNVASTL